MRHLKALEVDVYAVGTVQGEVGIRGTLGAARGIEPDIGVAIKINDAASISNHGIVEFLKGLAQKHKIKTQLEVLPFGGTDARAMQVFGRGGVCTLSIPTRYAHTPSEMISRRDVQGAVDLSVHFLESSHQCRLQFQ